MAAEGGVLLVRTDQEVVIGGQGVEHEVEVAHLVASRGPDPCRRGVTGGVVGAPVEQSSVMLEVYRSSAM